MRHKISSLESVEAPKYFRRKYVVQIRKLQISFQLTRRLTKENNLIDGLKINTHIRHLPDLFIRSKYNNLNSH